MRRPAPLASAAVHRDVDRMTRADQRQRVRDNLIYALRRTEAEEQRIVDQRQQFFYVMRRAADRVQGHCKPASPRRPRARLSGGRAVDGVHGGRAAAPPTSTARQRRPLLRQALSLLLRAALGDLHRPISPTIAAGCAAKLEASRPTNASTSSTRCACGCARQPSARGAGGQHRRPVRLLVACVMPAYPVRRRERVAVRVEDEAVASSGSSNLRRRSRRRRRAVAVRRTGRRY